MLHNRRALIVGINQYQETDDLHTAVADARAMEALLSQHQDGTPNYECRLLCDAMENGHPITRGALRRAYENLLAGFHGEVLFYFSGHGYLGPAGGYIATCDSTSDDLGVPMHEIVELADNSTVSDILLILDCCHSGDLGNTETWNGLHRENPLAVVRENMAIMAASLAPEEAFENGNHGRFTAALLDALKGGAADHLGWVTAPSMYAYAERRFGAWEQRPVYKSHATTVRVIRECAPLIERLKLRELVRYFQSAEYQFPLDPEFEPEDEHGNVHEPVNTEKVAIAKRFKEFRDAGLLKASLPGEQLFWTARRSHTVELTPRGREYWVLVSNKLI